MLCAGLLAEEQGPGQPPWQGCLAQPLSAYLLSTGCWSSEPWSKQTKNGNYNDNTQIALPSTRAERVWQRTVNHTKLDELALQCLQQNASPYMFQASHAKHAYNADLLQGHVLLYHG